MGTIGYYHLFTGHIATLAMIVIDGHQARQLTMCTSIGLKGEVSQTGQLAERFLQQRYQGQSTHHSLLWLLRMQVLKLWQCSHLLVNLRVVLHRTRT